MYGSMAASTVGISSAVGGALWRIGARQVVKQSSNRVFWSGGQKAMDTAANFARANNMTTLEMTRAGQNLTNLTKGLPWSEAAPMWQRLSAAYASGARGTVHVFHNAQGVGLNSMWRTIEYPILKLNKVRIIYHIVP